MSNVIKFQSLQLFFSRNLSFQSTGDKMIQNSPWKPHIKVLCQEYTLKGDDGYFHNTCNFYLQYKRSDEMDINSPYVLVAYNPLHTHELACDENLSIYEKSVIWGSVPINLKRKRIP
jgi:hypothetical protein